LDAAAEKVSFRGPDRRRIRLFTDDLVPAESGNNAFFFNRLAIIDLDQRSDQPFEDQRYTLLFNGEIYNFIALRQELAQDGCVFHTHSDTEVLFHALKQWGLGALARLNGMYSFCWIDRRERKFLLARDRMGIKPLYYRQLSRSLIFASEMDSVLRLSPEAASIDPESVRQFLWMQFTPTPNTILKGIFKLPPGHYLEGNWQDLEDQVQLMPVGYWDAYACAAPNKPESNPQDLERILFRSLRQQLVADVPLGFFLSSGVDSSLLAALMNRHLPDTPAHFFTVAFSENTASDESADAQRFIRGFENPSLIPHTLSIGPSDLGQRLDRLYDYFDEPLGDPASLLNWAISGKARESVTVAISGDGADELFWGYPRYNRWSHPSIWLGNRLRLPERLARGLDGVLPNGYLRSRIQLELERDPLKRHFALFLQPVLAAALRKPIWDDPLWALQGAQQATANREDQTALLDIKTYLADAMLPKVDRAGMAASLEVRVPYLDNEIVDFALTLPMRYKTNAAFVHKSLLKELLFRLAPHYPVRQAKKGFNFPLDRWLRFRWRQKLISLFTRDGLVALGLDDHLYQPMLQRYLGGQKRYCLSIWYLLNLLLWHQKYSPIQVLRPE
jgi:asparagine synthase (glutamine-hydrolysing)